MYNKCINYIYLTNTDNYNIEACVMSKNLSNLESNCSLYGWHQLRRHSQHDIHAFLLLHSNWLLNILPSTN